MDTATAFGLLGDETRVEILRQLLEAKRREPGEGSLSFAGLQEQCGVDRSNRLSYHLSELEKLFVTKAGEGRYQLTPAGVRVTQSVVQGAHLAGEQSHHLPLEAPCSTCDGSLDAVDEDGILVVRCPDCDTVEVRYFIPPGALSSRAPTDRARAIDAIIRRELALAADGVCPGCHGQLSQQLERDGDVHARYECEQCGVVLTEAVALRLQRHPAVASFYYDHGVDVEATPCWSETTTVEHETKTVTDNPLRVQVRFRTAEETLGVSVDADLSTTVDWRRTTQ